MRAKYSKQLDKIRVKKIDHVQKVTVTKSLGCLAMGMRKKKKLIKRGP